MITNWTITQIGEALRSKQFSARQVTQAFLDQIAAKNGQNGAFLHVCNDSALAAADVAQSRIDAGETGPLIGVPVAVKDNISTDGIPTTCASKILEGYIPPFDATVVERLKVAGAIIIGKTNLDEFAMGSSCETSAYQLTRNPWDLTKSPGGSSGGSAAAVAAGMAPISLGSDTGGSIRLPASFCGLVGFKPTYGRCSRYGLVAFASSLDQIGPLANTVEDAAILANAITGHCERESTSINAGPIEIEELKTGSLAGLRLAFPKEMYGHGTSDGVRAVFESALELLRNAGVIVDEVNIPTIALGVTTYYIIAPCEASSNLARFDGVRYGKRAEGEGHIAVVAKTRGQGFGHEVKARIMIGTYALSAGYYDAFYVKAMQVRELMTHQFNNVYASYDFVISPTSPVAAFDLGSLSEDPMALKVLDYCTIPANMGGFPSISIPAGCVPNGTSSTLPVGIQLTGPIMSDEKMLQISYQIEKLFNISHIRAPQLAPRAE